LDVAIFLADFLPVCPVLIHSSNTDRVYSMHNELRFAGWRVDRVGPIGTDWIETIWLRRVRGLLAEHGNTWKANLPPDHNERVARMQLSLDGLGLGDALGEMLSYQSANAAQRLNANDLPAGPWLHTDDTEMALSIVAVLQSHGELNQDALARRFARRFERDPDRGYGSMTRGQLREINAGAKWREMAAKARWGMAGLCAWHRSALILPMTLPAALMLPGSRLWSPIHIPKVWRAPLRSLWGRQWRGSCGPRRLPTLLRDSLTKFFGLRPKAKWAEAFCWPARRPPEFRFKMLPGYSATDRW
jgi:hypothetical protein